MSESKTARLDNLKELLGIDGVEKDSLLEFVIEAVEDVILSYINHETLPPQLEKVMIMMCASYYKAAGLGNASTAANAVASVKRGDVQTSFAAPSGGSASAATFNLGADGYDFFGWRTVLNGYRKLRW